jgi:putative spermidine/putrescine transport system permease protein
VLALPFTYRSLDAGIRALDLRTLVDASRSLGAGWGTTLRRALVPNLRAAIISSSFLTVAVVLGEYTIANVLLRDTLPTFMFQYRSREPQAGYGLAILVLVATTLLFAVLSLVTRPRSGRRRQADVPAVVGVEPAPVSPTTAHEEP